MPERSQVPSLRDIPGGPLIGPFTVTLVGLLVVALLTWRSVSELQQASLRRSAINQYYEAVTDLRADLQQTIIRGRTYALTGDLADIQAATAASGDAVDALERVRTLNADISPDARITRIDALLDTTTQRLLRIQMAGREGADVARALIREPDAIVRIQRGLSTLDSLVADAAAERQGVVARIAVLQRNIGQWVPLMFALTLVVGVLAVLLVRAHAKARAQDLTRFRAIFDNTFQFIGLLKPDGTLLEANRTALTFAGLKPDDVIGKPFWEASWWASGETVRDRLRAAVAQAAAGKFVRYTEDVLGAEGRRITIDFSLKPVLGLDGRVAYLVPEGRDVTEERANDLARAEAEERWNFALTGSDLGVWDWNAQTNEVFFSDRWKSMLGYAPHEVGNSLDEWSSRVHPEDLKSAMATVQEHLDGHTPYYASIHRVRTKDGSYREILDRGKVVSRDASGKPLRVIGTHQDITEQRQAEAEARQLQRQLSALMRFSPAHLSIVDREHRYVQVSESVATVIGRPVSEIAGHRITDVLPPPAAETFLARLRQVETSGRSIDVEETVGSPADERRYRVVMFPMRDDSGEIVAVGSVAINITEAHLARTRLEQALDENRVLQGLLSICAQCKRIRDGADQEWKPVEAYVQSHSAATFSHGLCPSCAAAFLKESGLDDGAA